MPAPTSGAVSQFVSSRGDMGPKYDLTLLSNKVVLIPTALTIRHEGLLRNVGRFMGSVLFVFGL